MTLSLKKYCWQFLLLLMGSGIVHLLIYTLAPRFLGIPFQMLYNIYGFLALLNVIHFIVLRWLFIKWGQYAGLLFTGLSLVKMAVCILFLFPFIFPSTISSIPFVFNFMAVYFIALFFEVLFLAKNIS